MTDTPLPRALRLILSRLPAAVLICAATGSGLALAQSQRAGHAHQHGVAKMDMVIDGTRVDFALEMPLDNLVGFERAPRNADEKKRVDAAVAKLQAADALFRFDAAAGCTLREVKLESGVLQLGGAKPPEKSDGHADLDGDFSFECRQPALVKTVELGLFSAFPRLQRLEVQAATPKGQFKRSLKRPDGKLSLGG